MDIFEMYEDRFLMPINDIELQYVYPGLGAIIDRRSSVTGHDKVIDS